jgi:hypothetical protein
MTQLRKNMARLLAAFLAVAVLAAMPIVSKATDVAGVNFTPQLKNGPHQLQLNGAGVRRMANNNLYSASLYLSTPARTPEGALDNPGAKQLRVQMLQDISARDIAQLLNRGLTSNSADDTLATLAIDVLFTRQ